MLRGKAQGRAVAARKLQAFAAFAAAPDGANGVDHIFRLQREAGRDAGFAGGAAADPDAGRSQFRTRRAMDRAADPAAGRQGFVGGVDDGVYAERGDIRVDDLDPVFLGLRAPEPEPEQLESTGGGGGGEPEDMGPSAEAMAAAPRPPAIP